MNSSPARRLEPWPIVIIIFFLVVFAANGVLVYLSQSTWNGLITEDAYNKGVTFNQALQAQRQQEALGWQVRVATGKLVSGQQARLLLTLLDREGHPLTGVQAQGVLFRPVREGRDQPLIFTEESPGVLVAMVTPPLPGSWDIKVRITHGEQPEYRLAQRVLVAATTP